jgi:hypothetical protein
MIFEASSSGARFIEGFTGRPRVGVLTFTLPCTGFATCGGPLGGGHFVAASHDHVAAVSSRGINSYCVALRPVEVVAVY